MKRHFSFIRTDAPNIIDSVDDRILSIDTQTDPVKVLSNSPEVCTILMLWRYVLLIS